MRFAKRTAARVGMATVAAGALAAGALALVTGASSSKAADLHDMGMHTAAADPSYGFRPLTMPLT